MWKGQAEDQRYMTPKTAAVYLIWPPNMTATDPTITSFTVRDLRWPTSLENIGSDPMNLAGENALGYLQYETDTGLFGTGWSFSNGQGNE